jgi:hypothetical protein
MPILFGVLLKIYDDIYDVTVYKEYFSELSVETIKSLLVCTLTYISLNNPLFPLILFIDCGILCFFDDKEFDSPFFKAGMITLFFLAAITFTPSNISLKLILFMLIILIGIYYDYKYFPEDHSMNKIIGRSIMIISIILLIIYLNKIIEYDESLFKLTYDFFVFCIGYLLMSVINMTFIEYYKKDELNKEEKKEEKK